MTTHVPRCGSIQCASCYPTPAPPATTDPADERMRNLAAERLAAGSGDETPEASTDRNARAFGWEVGAGRHSIDAEVSITSADNPFNNPDWRDRPAPVQPPAPDHAACEAETFGERKERDYWRERCDVMAEAFNDMRALLTEYRATGYEPAPYSQERALVERMEGLLSLTSVQPSAPDPERLTAGSGGMLGKMVDPYRGTDHPEFPAPAPDPDETCVCDPGPEGQHQLDRCPAPAPPATTGPADEAEGLAENILHALVPDWEQVAFRREANSRDWQQALNAAERILASDWLAARDAAQQRIGAEKALRDFAADIDATGYGWTSVKDAERFRSRVIERADRIAREGQA